MALKAKPVIYSVPSDDVKKSREPYSQLLGVDLVIGLTRRGAANLNYNGNSQPSIGTESGVRSND
jgi:hypothetical protein